MERRAERKTEQNGEESRMERRAERKTEQNGNRMESSIKMESRFKQIAAEKLHFALSVLLEAAQSFFSFFYAAAESRMESR
jgi:hypothetical protein